MNPGLRKLANVIAALMASVATVRAAATFTSLHTFAGGTDGILPLGSLVEGTDGNLYGTTAGGSDSFGTLFKITADGVLTTLYDFSGAADGSHPAAGLVPGGDGNFYGVTEYGGNQPGRLLGDGTVFKMTPAGLVTTLYTFSGGADGAHPIGALVQGADGFFYGTTSTGGNGFEINGFGTVFRVSPTGEFATLYRFSGGSDGDYPVAGLVLGSNGIFYGTTKFGGDLDGGTIFQITPAGVLTTLYRFSEGTDGGRPTVTLVEAPDGAFYGTTADGGSDKYFLGHGTIFKITSAGAFTTVWIFSGSNDGSKPGEGFSQDGTTKLTLGGDGNLYGSTSEGGEPHGTDALHGTLYQFTLSGQLTTLYTFFGGFYSVSPGALIQASDGTFYGSTQQDPNDGNLSGKGSVFKLVVPGVATPLPTPRPTPAIAPAPPALGPTPLPPATVVSLHSFTGGNEGSVPAPKLVQGTDGNFYGTTDGGDGTIFRMTPAGVVTTLFNFPSVAGGNQPGKLVQGQDGNFYGTTAGGFGAQGSASHGTVFQLTTTGAFTTLHTFSGGTDGEAPQDLIQANDGRLYGTTAAGGISAGTIFTISTTGAFTTLYSFSGGADGAFPGRALVQGGDGDFYGTTTSGGTGDGTVFKITAAGALTTLHNFLATTDGSFPGYELVQGIDGNFYGVATDGPDIKARGTFFRTTPTGNFTVLHVFSADGASGDSPQGGLVQASDGNFYGTTEVVRGARDEGGTVYRISPTGRYTTLFRFSGGDEGGELRSGVIQGKDGNLYGTTFEGGTSNLGTVFRVNLARANLLNISTRMRVLAGDNALIAGFIITGTDAKRIIVRGIGPSLGNAGVEGALTDPTLELHSGSSTIATNDNWKLQSDGSSQEAEIEATTIPPTNDLESALVATLTPGAYTAVLRGKSDSTGIGLVEVYDLEEGADSKLANISTRGFVDTGDNVMIGGLIVGGRGGGPAKVVVRALGPSLGASGVTGALADPTLELHDATGTTITSNDNWKTASDGSSQQADIEATTIPPTNDLESALVQTLSPGNYTAVVRGKNDTTGIALVEVYNLP